MGLMTNNIGLLKKTVVSNNNNVLILEKMELYLRFIASKEN